jgi:hypothetical protein
MIKIEAGARADFRISSPLCCNMSGRFPTQLFTLRANPRIGRAFISNDRDWAVVDRIYCQPDKYRILAGLENLRLMKGADHERHTRKESSGGTGPGSSGDRRTKRELSQKVALCRASTQTELNFQYFQLLEEEGKNERLLAIGRMRRSTAQWARDLSPVRLLLGSRRWPWCREQGDKMLIDAPMEFQLCTTNVRLEAQSDAS